VHPLSATQILEIWERGQGRHDIERALTLLCAAYPERAVQQLATLTVGQRDAHLLALRKLTFGSQLNCLTECPRCDVRLEFALNVADIQMVKPTELNDIHVQDYVLAVDEFELTFRLPTSWDLIALAKIKDATAMSAQLLRRCLLQASYRGMPVDVSALPLEAIAQLSETMVEADPQAEVLLALNCPACGHSWQALFDIVSFFWTELTVRAQHLLRDVHILARFYGWREADILAMSPVRRQFYLDLVS
jgi:uncharacterized protein (UPF0212 family)